ncbi:probable cytochrome P450 6a21 [Stomoxys calcitrans]|uniref:probable cytochrome P450 6a21 n=1 Tax=Stomoxys calcitrans TaxID=35570 RepID=UPI0027E3444A|nr:probable cytochrome P450 6a21 [Stomoxys calcitrans]
MMFTAVLLVTLVAILGYLRRKMRQYHSYWKRLGIPGEDPHWLMGNLPGFLTTTTIADSFQRFYEKFKDTGPFVGFYLFTKLSVFVLEPDLIKLVLIKDFSKFSDRGMFHNPEDDPLSGNLFKLEGNRWRNMRNKLSPTFTSGKMKNMFPLIHDIGKEFVRVFRQTMQHNEIVEVSDLMGRFTSDVIGTCAFGLDTNSLKDPQSHFRVKGKRSLNELRYGPLGIAFRMNFPHLARRLHMKETVADLEEYFLGLVRDTLNYREQNNVRRNDFMDMLIDLKNNKLMKSDSGEELTNLTFGEIAAQAFVFLVAGFETSSTTMAFALYELAQNTQIQDQAREEVLRVLEKHNQEFSYECMKEMVYLEQVINETLRLYPVVPFILRQASEDYEVPYNRKFVIKKGMSVIIPHAAIQRDEKYYPQPNRFNPENFSPKKLAERDSILYLPFGDGPRNCIGMRFGKMQVVIGLILLLKNFKFSVCPQTEIPVKCTPKNVLISPANGIKLRVTQV